MGTRLPQKRGTAAPIFGPYLLWPNSWMDQYVTWYADRPCPRRHCVTLGPSSPPKGAHPKFSPLMSIVAKRPPISYTAEHLFFSFSEYRADNFIVGLTDVSPATTAPTLWNYTVCAQYPGVVGDGTVYLPCASRMPPHRYLIVQIELVNENLNFCEIEVLVRRHRKLV